MRGVLVFCCILIFTACKKNEAVIPAPQPPEPKPTIQITATPSSTIEHGDSVTVSCTATNALTIPSPVKFRPLKDTTVHRTVYGLGGQAIDSIKITVTVPPDALYLTSGPWKLYSLSLYRASDATWIPYNLNHCDSVNVRKFSLDFRETKTSDNGCAPPNGIAVADWHWKQGPTGKRDSLYWGGPIYGVHQLTANLLVVRQNIPNFPPPGTTLGEWTYSR